MSTSRIPPSSPTDTARPGLRAKTVATRLSPEELQEVENAAERDGKSLAEWLRELALRSARERPADPIELLLADRERNASWRWLPTWSPTPPITTSICP